MWFKYKDVRFNFDTVNFYWVDDEDDYYIRFLIGKMHDYFKFDNKEKLDKALELIDNFIAIGNWNYKGNDNSKEVYYLLDLDKELENEN